MARALTHRNIIDRNVDLLVTRIIDFHGRRITNANDAIGDSDYVTKRQLDASIDAISVGGGGGGSLTSVESATMNAAPFNVSITATPTTGNSLVYILTQDGAGGKYPAWPASCENAPTAVDGTPGAKILVGFIGNGGKWVWDGRFVNGY